MEKMLCRDRFYRPIVVEKENDFYSIKLMDGSIELLAFEVDEASLVEMAKKLLEVVLDEV